MNTAHEFLTAWATSEDADPTPGDGWRDPVADPPPGYEDVLVMLPDFHGVGVAYRALIGRDDDGWRQRYPPSGGRPCKPILWRPMPARRKLK